MKTLLKTGLIAGCILFISCTRKQTANELLKDETTRNEIMTAICNDSDLTVEMINRMSTTGASQKMLPFSCQMLNKIMTSDVMKRDTAIQNSMMSGMLELMTHDSVLCDKTCTRMVNIRNIQRIMQKKK